MARNIYKEIEKAAKGLAKADQLLIQKDGEAVYVSEGHVIVKVPEGMYTQLFRTVSPRYTEMREDGTAEARGKKELPQMIPGGPDLRRCIPDQEGPQVMASPFLYELDGGQLTRIFWGEDQKVIAIKEEYYQLLKVFNEGRGWTGKGPKAAVCSEGFSYEDIGVLILPVNVGNMMLRIS